MDAHVVTYAVALKNNLDLDSGIATATATLEEDVTRGRAPRIKLVSRAGDIYYVDGDAIPAFFAAIAELKYVYAKAKRNPLA